MAFPLLAFALLATLAGTAVQAKASQNAARKKQQEVSNAITNASEFDKKITTRLNETVNDFNEDPREVRRQTFEDSNNEVLDRSIKSDRDELLGGENANVAGKISDAFKTGRAKRTEDVLANSLSLAKKAAKYQSSGQGGTKDIELFNQGKVAIGGINTEKRGQARVDQIRINSVRPNNTGIIVGEILKGLGMAASLGSAAGAGGAGAAAGGAGSSGGAVTDAFDSLKNVNGLYF